MVIFIVLGFVVAMMIGFVFPRKPLKLDLKGPPKPPNATPQR